MEKDKVIETLMNENKQCNNLINEIKEVLKEESSLEGFSLVGSVKELMKKYIEAKHTIYNLEHK